MGRDHDDDDDDDGDKGENVTTNENPPSAFGLLLWSERAALKCSPCNSAMPQQWLPWSFRMRILLVLCLLGVFSIVMLIVLGRRLPLDHPNIYHWDMPASMTIIGTTTKVDSNASRPVTLTLNMFTTMSMTSTAEFENPRNETAQQQQPTRSPMGMIMESNMNTTMKIRTIDNTSINNTVESTSEASSHVQDGTNEPDSGPLILLPQPQTSDFPWSISLVIQLGNEGMANQLSRIAKGFSIQWIMEELFQITPKVVLRHCEKDKWVRTWNSLISCFPNIRDMQTSLDLVEEFQLRSKQQELWLFENDTDTNSMGGTSSGASREHENNKFRTLTLEGIIHENETKVYIQEFAKLLSKRNPPPQMPVHANISIPFLYADMLISFDLVDRFYDKLRDLFEYNISNPECCHVRALPNETILHARGFEVEIPKLAKKRGFAELSPNKTVMELLKGFPSSHSIAVLGPFVPFGQAYVNRMRSVGINARFVETVNGENAFCFLLSGRDEIIGLAKSSFFRWASYLGNASKTRFYSLVTPERRTSMSSYLNFMNYNHTHPRLRDKFSFELYKSEQQDEMERQNGKS